MYKLICIDLDGTLLDDGKDVSKENAEIINRVCEQTEVIPVITTGRPYLCAEHIGNIVGKNFTNYIIAANGGIIRDNKKGIDIKRENISSENVRKVMDIAEKYNFKVIIDTGEEVYDDTGSGGTLYKKIGHPVYHIENLMEKLRTEDISGYNITLTGKIENLIKATEEFKEMGTVEPTPICEYKIKTGMETLERTYIDILPKGVTKKDGIIKLAEYLNVKKEEIMVIGDGGNDLPMFDVAGLKVAMQNGLEIVRNSADYVTIGNNENGVAKAIKKFIFNEESN